MKEWGVPDNYVCQAFVILGYIDGEQPHSKPRNPGRMEEKYGFHDMYSGSFYDYGSLEEMWAFWSRDIFINRFMDAPKSVYLDIFSLVKEKNYFVLTTNVDHCFQKAGFDQKRLFYTQGDYGLFQCSEPCHKNTYDNKQMIISV